MSKHKGQDYYTGAYLSNGERVEFDKPVNIWQAIGLRHRAEQEQPEAGFTVHRYARGSHKKDKSFPTKEEAMDRLQQVGAGNVTNGSGEVIAASYPYGRPAD